MTSKPETGLSDAIKTACQALGCIVIRVHAGRLPVRGGWMHHNEEGIPDRLVLGPNGQSVWLEIKRPGKQLEKPQKEWQMKAARLGHIVVRVDSVESAVKAVREELRI